MSQNFWTDKHFEIYRHNYETLLAVVFSNPLIQNIINSCARPSTLDGFSNMMLQCLKPYPKLLMANLSALIESEFIFINTHNRDCFVFLRERSRISARSTGDLIVEQMKPICVDFLRNRVDKFYSYGVKEMNDKTLMKKEVNWFIDTIFSDKFVERIPIQVKFIVHQVYTLAHKYGYEKYAYMLTGNCLILRMICPFISVPEFYNICSPNKGAPAMPSRKCLTLVGKILSNLANATGGTFELDEQLIKYKDIIQGESYKQRYRDWIDKIIGADFSEFGEIEEVVRVDPTKEKQILQKVKKSKDEDESSYYSDYSYSNYSDYSEEYSESTSSYYSESESESEEKPKKEVKQQHHQHAPKKVSDLSPAKSLPVGQPKTNVQSTLKPEFSTTDTKDRAKQSIQSTTSILHEYLSQMYPVKFPQIQTIPLRSLASLHICLIQNKRQIYDIVQAMAYGQKDYTSTFTQKQHEIKFQRIVENYADCTQIKDSSILNTINKVLILLQVPPPVVTEINRIPNDAHSAKPKVYDVVKISRKGVEQNRTVKFLKESYLHLDGSRIGGQMKGVEILKIKEVGECGVGIRVKSSEEQKKISADLNEPDPDGDYIDRTYILQNTLQKGEFLSEVVELCYNCNTACETFVDCSGGLRLYLTSDSILCVKNSKHIAWDRHLARLEVSNDGASGILIKFEKELNVFVDETYEVVSVKETTRLYRKDDVPDVEKLMM